MNTMHMLPAIPAMMPGSTTWYEHTEDGIVLRARCPTCGEVFSKAITEDELANVERLYANGGFHPDGHMQDIFPSWTAAERELFLQSHLCDGCWKMVMGS